MGFRDKLSTNIGNGGKRGFFKPVEFKDAYVLFVEPKSYVEDARNPFYDPDESRSKPTRLEVTADITAFATPEHLEAKAPTSVLQDIVVTDLYLALDLKEDADKGKVSVTRLEQRPNKKGKPSWVFRAAEGNVLDLVEEFYEDREKQLDDAEAAFSEIEV